MILSIDTCLGASSVAVLDGERVLAARSEPMTRGHQERIGVLARETAAEAGIAFADLSRIGVTVGPGSFTGLRVGLAFAKGLATALSIPCVGVNTLESLAFGTKGFAAAIIDARMSQVYLQVFADGVSLMAPDALGLGEAAARLAELYSGGPATLIGSGAPLLADALPSASVLTSVSADPVAVARLAAAKPTPSHSPRPLYLRAPYATLPAA
ncbi:MULTISPECIES: tRNA (adenosine(37)-N6)-threonylcarbamoyltransferase complex dimerization subunit type 1 TsaB [unclassified Caulobacter]|uniref:tRNA (adenosine(37)-N6)-threonylcarbamoyltransferase complex dimerization subunit type 1 TsaB n=1 Tax=unclassified Caulobacter TaxID=2648921 RepID=UPI0007004FF7|nr:MULTISPECIES: tRNA (adenosine(37)-N6)-threonylcarbamoyltransferase complex dimerization subunit type 1 TsaB [unclassified Caulobacter]KQV62209.1 tRNA threonylcarbamoyladenosine biosynthesis protein TsaB [Caulobacter sp. Root342]KQV63129.1 tRNA threonylcarbamoyladenosine biosynthesis protein TsaB [Caulobacter sp. Root343]